MMGARTAADCISHVYGWGRPRFRHQVASGTSWATADRNEMTALLAMFRRRSASPPPRLATGSDRPYRQLRHPVRVRYPHGRLQDLTNPQI